MSNYEGLDQLFAFRNKKEAGHVIIDDYDAVHAKLAFLKNPEGGFVLHTYFLDDGMWQCLISDLKSIETGVSLVIQAIKYWDRVDI